MGRALSLGVTLAAPAVVMSAILGWTLPVDRARDLRPDDRLHDDRRRAGGRVDRRQADVRRRRRDVGGGRRSCSTASCTHVSFGQALHLAGATGRLQAIDFRFDLRETYTFWSGMIGGLFLMLSYFGCDQSQVQRYLTAKSIDEARQSLLMSAFVKIPLQLLILLDRRARVRLLPVPGAADAVQPRVRRAGARRARRPPQYAALERDVRRAAIAGAARARRRAATARAFLASRRARRATSARRRPRRRQGGDRRRALQRRQLRLSDLHHDAHADRPRRADDRGDLRGGDVGERRRAERARDGDGHRFLPAALRHARRPTAHYLRVSKLATIGWGLFACVVAMYAANQGSLIEVVNRYGSFFYGSLLGVFILAILTKRATGARRVLGPASPAWPSCSSSAFTTPIAFLWHNLIGAVVVVVVGMAISYLRPASGPPGPEGPGLREGAR